MKLLNEILFIVQARLNSSRLPGKMLKPFSNTTLFDITLEKVNKSIIPPSSFYVSINEKELIEAANKHKVNIYLRSDQSIRNDDINPFSVKELFEWRELPFKYFIIMNACNPLVKIETINNFVKEFQKIKGGLLSVKKHKHWFYTPEGKFVQHSTGGNRARMTFNSKYVQPLYSNGPIKGGLISDLKNNIYCWDQQSKPNVFIYPDDEYTDIDYQHEFDISEQLYIKRNEIISNRTI
jgi:CMP-N-acetylneuraminic acid synthetase